MKNQFLLIVFFIALCRICLAQEYSHEFGKNSGNEFLLKAVEYDSAAQAVVIYDIGKTSFLVDDFGFKILYERQFKIKILKPGGLSFAEFHIPFYSEGTKSEVVSDIAGNTYNFENNAVRTTPFNTRNMYIEKDEENVKVMKFALPDVKEGSVIEIKYSILSPFHSRYQSWIFQSPIPVLYSEYSTTLNPIIEYKYTLQGAKNFDLFRETQVPGVKQFHGDSYSEKNILFAMNNVPAFKEESHMPAVKDYLIKLDFRLIRYNYPVSGVIDVNSSWSVIVDNLLDVWDDFGKYLKSCQHKAKGLTDTMKLQGLSQRQVAEKIEKYVKSNFKWNNNNSIYASNKGFSEFLNTRTGNCADINLFLAGMLNAAGVEAYPLLISTRKHGRIKPAFPAVNNFNYVLVYVKTDSSKLILDATDPLCDFRQIPIPCLNEMGLIVKKGKELNWLKFNSPINSFITTQMEFYPDLTKDLITGSFHIVAGGYDALELRKSYLKDPRELKKALNINAYSFPDSVMVENSLQPAKDLLISFRAEIDVLSDKKNTMEKVEKRLLFHPFSNLVVSENPFVQPTRTFPIVFETKLKRQFISTITIPPGYTVSSKPDDLHIDNEIVFIQYSSETLNDSTVRVTGIYEFKKERYEASAYDEIKGYFNTIINKFHEQIVFVKP
jgi:hypothetical protein